MAQARIPAKGVSLVAISDDIVVYDRADLTAGHQRYSYEGPFIQNGDTEENYHYGSPLGESLGVTETSPDGTEFIKTRTSSWKAKFLFGWTETKRDSFIELAKEGLTWQRNAPDGASEADTLAAFKTDVETNYLPTWIKRGIPTPTYSITDGKLKLTFPNGYSALFEVFRDLTVAEQLALTVDSPSPVPKPDPTPNLNIWAIIAGAGLLTLLGVVVLIQVQRRRRHSN